jgi:hypothetical protein
MVIMIDNKNLVFLLVQLEFRKIFYSQKVMEKTLLGMPFGKAKHKSPTLVGQQKSEFRMRHFDFPRKKNKLGESIS